MRLKHTGTSLLTAFVISCLSMALPLRAGNSITELFITEYIEGSSFNKAIEIYNGTGFAKDLGGDSMTLEIYFNGNGSPGQTINLTGTLNDGDVFVIAHGQAAQDILDQADQTTNSLSFNGDDAIVLKKNGVIIDVLGQVGFDPGSEWGSGDVSTQNNTIRRKEDVCGGDTDGSNAFDPTVEWDGFANNTFDGLGSHTATCGPGTGIAFTCGGPISTTFGQSLVHPISASDVDGTIVDIIIVSVTPGHITAPITIQNLVPAVGVGGTATAEVHVPDTYPVGSFDITLRAINDDMSPETSQCVLKLGVAGVRTIAEIQGTPSTQGPDGASPVAGAIIQTTGVVTAIKVDGFFMQMAPGDGDPESSDGIFVYTQDPPMVAVGDEAQVTGEVIEFFGLTEFSNGPTVQVLNSGLPLPPPVPLSSTFPDPTKPLSQLEPIECMLVSLTNGLVTTPGRLNFGIDNFYAVAEGTLRNMREPGLEPPGLPNLPLFDTNPETIRVDLNQLVLPVPGGVPPHPVAGQTVTATGPMEFRFGDFRLLADDTFSIGGPATATPVRDRQTGEFTVASFNMQFLETSNPTKIQKASNAIRNVLKAPDIIALQEVVDQAALDALATQIATDDPTINYTAMVPADTDGFNQEVAYLIKDTVSNTAFSEFGIGQTYPNSAAACSPETLHNRPPYILDCTVTPPGGQAYDITVINLHLRSLSGIDNQNNGERVRMKRFLAASTLAGHIETMQTGDPNRRILVVGDFNAYQFTDGYVDVVGIIAGNPDIDLIESNTYPEILTTPLRRLGTMLPSTEQYSFVFGKNAQQLDHILASDNFGCDISGLTVARLNADFPFSIFETNANVPERTSDHDPPLVYIQTATDPLPIIQIQDASSLEGTGGATQMITFTLSLCSSSTENVAVDWTLVSGTARSGDDFAQVGDIVIFSPGSTEETVQVAIIADADKESNEDFFIRLNQPQNAIIGDPEARGLIINDDANDGLQLDIISSILRTDGDVGLRAWPTGGTGQGTFSFQWIDVTPTPTLMFDPDVNPVVIDMAHPMPAAFRILVDDALGNTIGGTTIIGDTVPILAPNWNTNAPNFEWDNDGTFTVSDWIAIINFSQQKDNAYPCDP